MKKQATTRRPGKRLWIGVTLGVLLALLVALVWYLRSAAFEDVVRRKVIATLEESTGGRVEMASFHWNLSQLAFEAKDLTIHGLEPAGKLPYVHIDRTLVRLHIISVLERRFDLERLELDHPTVHIIVNPDGSTNAPGPKVKIVNAKEVAQQLFRLAIGHTDVRDGMAVINGRKIPLDFAVSDVVAAMSYEAHLGAHRYLGSVQVGKMDFKYQDFRDVAARGKVEFTLQPDGVTIQSLELASQDSKLHASGEITNLNQPKFQLSYTALMNVPQFAAVVRASGMNRGTLQADGSAGYSEAEGYTSNGHIALRDFDYISDGLTMRQARLDSNYKWESDRLSLTRIAARVLGGVVNGDVEVKNILGGNARPTKKVQQDGSARLRVSALSLNEIARAISSRALPLEKLNTAGSVTGSVDATWKESPANAVADLNLAIAAPAKAAANQLPVSGNVRGRYSSRAQRIELAALNLTTPHSHVEASGLLGSTSATLKLDAQTTSLAELQPMLAAMGNPAGAIELAGRASFDGTLSGALRAPAMAGHIEATSFIYVYTPPQVEPTPDTRRLSKGKEFQRAKQADPAPDHHPAPPRRIHIDRFAGDVQYSQAALTLHHAVIEESGAQLKLDGSAALYQGKLTDSSEFQVQTSLHNGNLAELQRDLGLQYPVQGNLSFTIHAAGTVADPHAQGQLSLSQGDVRGYALKTLTSKISFANHTAELQDLHLLSPHGAIAGSLAYDFRSGAGKLDVNGQGIELADIPELQRAHLQLAGKSSFKLQAAGTLDRPTVNAHIEIDRLLLNEDVMGAVTAEAITEGRRLTLTARSRLPQGNLTLDGTAQLEGEMPVNAALRFASFDIAPFLPANMRSQLTRLPLLDGRAQVSGPLKQPQLLHGDLEIQQFSMEVDHLPVRSDGLLELSLADQALTVRRCALVSEDTRFEVSGRLGLQGDRRLELRANGSLNLKLGELIDPELTSYGIANINLSLGGTTAQPVAAGRVEIQHAGLSKVDMPVGFSDLSGTLVFDHDRLQVENVAGRMGGGQVKLGGFVTLGRTVGLNLTADGSDVRFRYSGLSVTSDQTLRLTGTLQNATLTGNITVTRFAQAPATDLQLLLSQAAAPPSVPNPKSPLNNIHLEVRILSTPELTVQTSLAKLSGDVDLRLRGTAVRPVLLGRINIAEGDLKVAGTKYHLERGDITFVNPVRIDPVLDVEATTRVRDFDITIGLHGTMERLNTTYRSDPPLSTDDIISLLAFGRTQTENALGGGAPNPGFSENASGALLSSALNQVVTNRVSKIFGSSSIRINPSFGGPENDPNARLTLEQQVSNDITFTYITNLARSAQEVIQFEYNINREYTLQGIRDENGVVSFDLLIRKRKR